MSETITEVIEQPQAIQYYNPPALLALAIQKDLDVERLAKLMELQERWQANEAKKAFTTAMAELKKNPPQIIKDMHVEFQTSRGKTSYNHASLGNVTASVTEALSNHGLSTRWETTQTDMLVTVKCIITHIDGHSESTQLSSKPDDSGGKNHIQAIGSAVTYLQRYTLLTITGLATNEFENDGRGMNGNGTSKEAPQKPEKASSKKSDPDKEFKVAINNIMKELNRKTGADETFFKIVGDFGFSCSDEILGNDRGKVLKALNKALKEVA